MRPIPSISPGWRRDARHGGSRRLAAIPARITDGSGRLEIWRAISALPASACDRKGSISGFRCHGHLGLGMPESAPCPLIAAGFCERADRVKGRVAPASRRRRRPWGGRPGADHARRRGRGALVCGISRQRFWLVAFLRGVISRGGRGRGQEQPALPRPAGLWVLPRRHDD
jgi:hypothetical protein